MEYGLVLGVAVLNALGDLADMVLALIMCPKGQTKDGQINDIMEQRCACVLQPIRMKGS